MPFQAQLAIPTQDMRTARRRMVNFTAFLRESGATIVPVEVTDLSADGCRLVTTHPLETAITVWLKIPGVGGRQVKIIWNREGAYGCEFVSSVGEEMIDQLCQAEERKVKDKLRVGAAGFGRAVRA